MENKYATAAAAVKYQYRLSMQILALRQALKDRGCTDQYIDEVQMSMLTHSTEPKVYGPNHNHWYEP